MKSDKLIIEKLSKLNIPITRSLNTVNHEQFIVLQVINGRPVEYADDDSLQLCFTFRLHLFSKSDFTDELFNIINIVKNEIQAQGIFINAEIFEYDTKYYHIPIDFKIIESEN